MQVQQKKQPIPSTVEEKLYRILNRADSHNVNGPFFDAFFYCRRE